MTTLANKQTYKVKLDVKTVEITQFQGDKVQALISDDEHNQIKKGSDDKLFVQGENTDFLALYLLERGDL